MKTLSFIFSFSLMLAFNSAIAGGVLFRYLPGRPEVSSQVIAEGIETGPLLEPHELTARGPGGWGLLPPHSAEFEGSQSTLRSANADSFRQILGPQITVEAWFQIVQMNQRVALVNNRLNSGEGFDLYLQNGQAAFDFSIGNKTYSVRSPHEIEIGENHWLAAVVNYDGFKLSFEFFQNGLLVDRAIIDTTLAGPYHIRGPYFVGTTAEGDPNQPALTGSLTGHLFGATVRRYVANETYLRTPASFDGSAFFGGPAYHEYPLASNELPVDTRINSSPTKIQRSVYVPYANDFYVLQGIASHYEINENDTTRLVYMSAYHLTRDGTTRTHPSVIVELDVDRHLRVRRCFRIRGQLETSHVGGIAYSHGAIFVASQSTLERYPLPPYEGPEGGKYFVIEPDRSGTINVLSKASFVSAENDTLWVGDFRWPNEIEPFLYGYPLDEAGIPISNAEPPKYSLPKRVQGVDFYTYDGVRYCFLSLSGGSSISEILRIRADQLHPTQPPPVDTTFILPRGGEDLSFTPGGSLWSGSESGSDHFQKRANPWREFFPFIYEIPAEALFGDIPLTTGVVDHQKRNTPPVHFQLDCFPNPFNARQEIIFTLPFATTVLVRVFDIWGREVVKLAQGSMSAGRQRIQWQANDLPSALYYIQLETPMAREARATVLVK